MVGQLNQKKKNLEIIKIKTENKTTKIKFTSKGKNEEDMEVDSDVVLQQENKENTWNLNTWELSK